MNRYVGGLLAGLVIGAAAGTYWFTQTDRRTQRKVKEQGMRVTRVARRSARAVQTSARRLDPAWQAGKAVISSAVRNLH